MLTETDFNNLKSSRAIIEHVTDGEPKRITFEQILAILDFILLGIKSNFFTDMGKPKNKLQLILSIPTILRFVLEVIKRIHGDMNKPNRVKGLSAEAKVAKAVEDGVKRSMSIKGSDIAATSRTSNKKGGSNIIEF